ncbi:ABC transporter permease [Cellulomonas xylanilytica]|uniref:Transport permease protein n=1 Tax=Cellulomonas xylanilytica TaxID=233583 RepID=A0A510V883_9CELL|nr:ABC transporter permease [Cellulomonas xylanilytica]GEK22986.1 transport permease protein [Cellulomonas xylanilytica]
MTTLTAAPPALGWTAHDTTALIDRCLRRSLRQLDTVLMAVILPVVLLLLFVYVFGGAIQTGGDYVNWVVPGIVLLTAGYGSATTAVDVASDMTGGIIDRFRSLPIRPTGVLTGHVVASMARNAVSTVLVFAVAILIGFDAAASPVQWLGAIGLIALFVLALTWVAVAIGIVASGPEAASGFTFAILFLPYVSSAFVPPESMPSVLETLATYNPITPVTDTLRGLLLGVPAGDSWVAAVTWCLGIFVVARLVAAGLFRRTR